MDGELVAERGELRFEAGAALRELPPAEALRSELLLQGGAQLARVPLGRRDLRTGLFSFFFFSLFLFLFSQTIYSLGLYELFRWVCM